MKLEQKVNDDLNQFLLSRSEIDSHTPEAFDIEQLWEKIAQSYIPDGVREFRDYPTVSLGWMMYIGMAIAKFWDDEWTLYNQIDDLYLYMRDKGGYDVMDEYIRGTVLQLTQPAYDDTESLVQECSERTYSLLMRQGLEPGTEDAFRGYVACLHQLYLMGAYVQLHRMGYHMVRM